MLASLDPGKPAFSPECRSERIRASKVEANQRDRVAIYDTFMTGVAELYCYKNLQGR